MSDESTPEASSESADLEQIRQILYGSFAHDVDLRFGAMDERITNELGRLSGALDEFKQSVTERFDSTASRIKQEVAMLHESIAASREDGEQKRGEIHQQLSATKNELHQQLGALGNTLTAAEQSMRHDMHKGLGQLKGEIRAQLEEINQRMQNEFSRLGDSTVTRTSFRDALRELSSQFDAEDG